MTERNYYVDHMQLGYCTATFLTLEGAVYYVEKGLGCGSEDETFYVGAIVDEQKEQPTFIYFRGEKYTKE